MAAWKPKNDESPPLCPTKVKTTDKDETATKKLHEEFVSFKNTMEELRLLKSIAADLKNYRKMIRLKKYD
jgi:hypothetical protein